MLSSYRSTLFAGVAYHLDDLLLTLDQITLLQDGLAVRPPFLITLSLSPPPWPHPFLPSPSSPLLFFLVPIMATDQ